MNFKKIPAVAAALSITLCTFTGCNEKTESNIKGQNLKYIMAGPGNQKDSEKVWAEFNKKISEKVPGVTVNFEIIPLSEYNQKFMLMCSAREQIDIVNNYSLDFAKEVKNGSFEPLDDLLKKDGQDLTKALPEWIFDYQKMDGKIYGIPTYQMCGAYRGIYFFKEQADKYLDIDKFKKALYSSPVFTQEVYDILEKYMDDIKADGGTFEDTTILNTRGRESISSMYGIRLGDEKCNVENIYLNDESYLRCSVARKWFEKKYIRQDVLSATDVGKNMGGYGVYPFWDEVYTPFVAQQLSEKSGHEVICVPYEDKYYTGYKNSAAGTSIMSTCKDKESAMKILNMIQSDKKIYNLLAFGIEGDHYKKTGEDSITTEYDSPSENDRYGLFKWILGNTQLAYNIQTEPEEYKNWVFEEANKSDWRSPLIGFTPDTSKIQDYITQVSAVSNKYLQSLLAGALPDWEKSYNDFKNEIDSVGGKEIQIELQKQVDEFLKK